MKNLKDLLVEVTTEFSSSQFSNPKRQAEDLLCDLLDFKRIQLYTQLDYPLTNEEHLKAISWLKRRLQGEPLAYIKGKVEFYECHLIITPSVLIPRQETEILVDKIFKFLKGKNLKEKIFLDLCCGSGCIGIAIKKKFPELTVFLSDISPEAISLAKENARINQVEIHFLEGDLLTPFHQRKADFVVCNPPYISQNEYAQLDPEVKNFEPSLALIAGDSGLEIYNRLAVDLPPHLNPHACVWFEIGYCQGESIKKIFNETYWVKKYFENDWSGQNRFFFLENE